MAWDIGADEYSTGGATTYTRQVALDAVLAPITKTATLGLDARLQGGGAGGGPWDIGADELTGTEGLTVGLDARVVDLTNSQTVTVSLGGALAPPTPSGLTVVSYGVSWVSLSWTDNSGGTAQHRVYYRKIGETTYTEWGLLWLNDTAEVVRYLDAGQTYVFAVAAVSTDGVEGPIITVTQATEGGAEITAGLDALVRGNNTLGVSLSAFIQYASTGPGALTTRIVSGSFL